MSVQKIAVCEKHAAIFYYFETFIKKNDPNI